MDESIKEDVTGRWIHLFLRVGFSSWLHNFTLWFLHYCWPFETQDDWNILSLAASSQYHDDHPCICTDSRINNVTSSCLARITLSAACCVRAAAVVAVQWHSMLQFSACGVAAPVGGAGLQPGEPQKKFQGRPVFGALASLGPGRDWEAGCSYWIWLL
jgi:hypothetical protein